jgi:hypothetical protein
MLNKIIDAALKLYGSYRMLQVAGVSSIDGKWTEGSKRYEFTITVTRTK